MVTNFKAAASPTFVADQGAKRGQRRRIDVPMQGMTSVITRRIRPLDARTGTVRVERLKSVYAPWGAVYAVHPRDARLRPQ